MLVLWIQADTSRPNSVDDTIGRNVLCFHIINEQSEHEFTVICWQIINILFLRTPNLLSHYYKHVIWLVNTHLVSYTPQHEVIRSNPLRICIIQLVNTAIQNV